MQRQEGPKQNNGQPSNGVDAKSDALPSGAMRGDWNNMSLTELERINAFFSEGSKRGGFVVQMNDGQSVQLPPMSFDDFQARLSITPAPAQNPGTVSEAPAELKDRVEVLIKINDKIYRGKISQQELLAHADPIIGFVIDAEQGTIKKMASRDGKGNVVCYPNHIVQEKIKKTLQQKTKLLVLASDGILFDNFDTCLKLYPKIQILAADTPPGVALDFSFVPTNSSNPNRGFVKFNLRAGMLAAFRDAGIELENDGQFIELNTLFNLRIMKFPCLLSNLVVQALCVFKDKTDFDTLMQKPFYAAYLPQKCVAIIPTDFIKECHQQREIFTVVPDVKQDRYFPSRDNTEKLWAELKAPDAMETHKRLLTALPPMTCDPSLPERVTVRNDPNRSQASMFMEPLALPNAADKKQGVASAKDKLSNEVLKYAEFFSNQALQNQGNSDEKNTVTSPNNAVFITLLDNGETICSGVITKEQLKHHAATKQNFSFPHAEKKEQVEVTIDEVQNALEVVRKGHGADSSYFPHVLIIGRKPAVLQNQDLALTNTARVITIVATYNGQRILKIMKKDELRDNLAANRKIEFTIGPKKFLYVPAKEVLDDLAKIRAGQRDPDYIPDGLILQKPINTEENQQEAKQDPRARVKWIRFAAHKYTMPYKLESSENAKETTLVIDMAKNIWFTRGLLESEMKAQGYPTKVIIKQRLPVCDNSNILVDTIKEYLKEKFELTCQFHPAELHDDLLRLVVTGLPEQERAKLDNKESNIRCISLKKSKVGITVVDAYYYMINHPLSEKPAEESKSQPARRKKQKKKAPHGNGEEKDQVAALDKNSPALRALVAQAKSLVDSHPDGEIPADASNVMADRIDEALDVQGPKKSKSGNNKNGKQSPVQAQPKSKSRNGKPKKQPAPQQNPEELKKQQEEKARLEREREKQRELREAERQAALRREWEEAERLESARKAEAEERRRKAEEERQKALEEKVRAEENRKKLEADKQRAEELRRKQEAQEILFVAEEHKKAQLEKNAVLDQIIDDGNVAKAVKVSAEEAKKAEAKKQNGQLIPSPEGIPNPGLFPIEGAVLNRPLVANDGIPRGPTYLAFGPANGMQPSPSQIQGKPVSAQPVTDSTVRMLRIPGLLNGETSSPVERKVTPPKQTILPQAGEYKNPPLSGLTSEAFDFRHYSAITTLHQIIPQFDMFSARTDASEQFLLVRLKTSEISEISLRGIRVLDYDGPGHFNAKISLALLKSHQKSPEPEPGANGQDAVVVEDQVEGEDISPGSARAP